MDYPQTARWHHQALNYNFWLKSEYMNPQFVNHQQSLFIILFIMYEMDYT